MGTSGPRVTRRASISPASRAQTCNYVDAFPARGVDPRGAQEGCLVAIVGVSEPVSRLGMSSRAGKSIVLVSATLVRPPNRPAFPGPWTRGPERGRMCAGTQGCCERGTPESTSYPLGSPFAAPAAWLRPRLVRPRNSGPACSVLGLRLPCRPCTCPARRDRIGPHLPRLGEESEGSDRGRDRPFSPCSRRQRPTIDLPPIPPCTTAHVALLGLLARPRPAPRLVPVRALPVRAPPVGGASAVGLLLSGRCF